MLVYVMKTFKIPQQSFRLGYTYIFIKWYGVICIDWLPPYNTWITKMICFVPVNPPSGLDVAYYGTINNVFRYIK